MIRPVGVGAFPRLGLESALISPWRLFMMKGQLKRIGTIGVFSLCNKLVGLAVTQNSLSVERSGLEAIDVLVALVLHNKLPPPL